MSVGKLSWDSQKSVGAPPVGLAVDDCLGVGSNLDGRLEVFALGMDGAVWHTWEVAPNSEQWSDWATFGPFLDDATFLKQGLAIQAVSNQDGRLEIFIVDDSWNVWHIWQGVPNGGWVSQWSSLGSPGPASSYEVIVAPNDIAALDLYMLNEDTYLISCKSQLQPNGNWEDTWTSMGGASTLGRPGGKGHYSYEFLVSGQNRTISTQVISFMRGTNRFWGTQRSHFVEGASSWSPWISLFSLPDGVILDQLVTLKNNEDKRLELFLTDSNGGLWHTWQLSDGITWSGDWDNLGQPVPGLTKAIDVWIDINYQLTIVAWGQDSQIYWLAQTAPNNGWGKWNAIYLDDSSAAFSIYNTSEIILRPEQSTLLAVFMRQGIYIDYMRQMFQR